MVVVVVAATRILMAAQAQAAKSGRLAVRGFGSGEGVVYPRAPGQGRVVAGERQALTVAASGSSLRAAADRAQAETLALRARQVVSVPPAPLEHFLAPSPGMLVVTGTAGAKATAEPVGSRRHGRAWGYRTGFNGFPGKANKNDQTEASGSVGGYGTSGGGGGGGGFVGGGGGGGASGSSGAGAGGSGSAQATGTFVGNVVASVADGSAANVTTGVGPGGGHCGAGVGDNRNAPAGNGSPGGNGRITIFLV